MPTYDYKCKECEHELEIIHSMSEELIYCPSCQLPTFKKVIGVANFSFKGEGWASKEIRSNKIR